MPGPDRDERAEITRELLQGAIPLNPANPPHYVTREEFFATVTAIEAKIEVASSRQKIWVLSGCVAILISFGGGYVSLVSKIDRLTDALPAIAAKQDARAPWIQRQEQRDAMQDQALQKLDPKYQPLPYQEPPQ